MKNHKKIVVLLLTLLLTLSCAMPISAAIRLSKKSIALKEGQTYTINLKGTNKKGKWTISNSKIKKLTSNNKKIKIKALKSGTAYVICKVNSKTYKCKVVVKKEKTTTSYVYISETGSKYHSKTDCGRMNGGTKIKKSTAKNQGYEACKICY